MANSNVSKILFVFKSKNNFLQCFISIEKKINKQITISIGIQGPAMGIPVVVVDMNETEWKEENREYSKVVLLAVFILPVCLIVKNLSLSQD